MVSLPKYAELHCLSNFTFLRGASHPHELVERAVELGYTALALTDECSVAGVVKAHIAAKQAGLHLVIGSEFTLSDGFKFMLLAQNRQGYGQLCQLISKARQDAPKGDYYLSRGDIEIAKLTGCLALWIPSTHPSIQDAQWFKSLFQHRCWIAFAHLYLGDEGERLAKLRQISAETGMPMVACGDVHMHTRGQRALQDTLTAIRLNTPLAKLGYCLYPNGERHLRPRSVLEELYPEDLLAQTLHVAGRCTFSLDQLRYEYPSEIVPEGETASSWLRTLVYRGTKQRWPAGVPSQIQHQIEHEMALIQELSYEPYFLTVNDVVQYARRQGILCQGRGSAANSVVCFCLGITSVDPERMSLLFERFISRERQEPPDIDVDFEHERREEVIQYMYSKYGERAALAATVITYQGRSAIRDIGKALGLTLDQVERLSRLIQHWDEPEDFQSRLLAEGFDPENRIIHQLLTLTKLLLGFPRHLSQHPGGFVIAQTDLTTMVPIENASMPERTVIQWDKDDLDTLGLIKVDILGLGMLTTIRKCFELIKRYKGHEWSLASIPAEDPDTYAMIQKADTVGVFQIESRAQMSMLPRLRPRNFYDLVVSVAIIRPGPIQGDMVHPYLERRAHPENVVYPSDDLKPVLQRTLGVPIFQEQVMQIAIVAAGFSPGEADQLRRSMATWQKRGGLEPFQDRLISGMLAKGYSLDFAERIWQQVKGFGGYGFPESHAASFALLTYVSSWLKCHEPEAFTAALLNNQPLGFYAPAQLIADARRHDIQIRPADVMYSDWDCTLEHGVRLGLRMVKGLSEIVGQRIAQARHERAFGNLNDLADRACLTKADIELLASADALQTLCNNRHQAYWRATGVEPPLGALFGRPSFTEATPMLIRPTLPQAVLRDVETTGVTTRAHPVELIRRHLAAYGVTRAIDLKTKRHGAVVKVAGQVTHRQRPGTASGVVFLTLEDETGFANIIVWPKVVAAQWKPLLESHLMIVSGIVQIEQNVIHVIAGRIENHTNLFIKAASSPEKTVSHQ